MRKTTAFLLSFVTALVVSVATSLITPQVAAFLPSGPLPTFNPNWQTAAPSWTTFTPTGSLTTNATYTGAYATGGKILWVEEKIAFAGATDTASCTLDLPSGITADEGLAVLNYTCGSGILLDSSTGATRGILLLQYNRTNNNIDVLILTTSPSTLTAFSNTVPVTIAASDACSFSYWLPIN